MAFGNGLWAKYHKISHLSWLDRVPLRYVQRVGALRPSRGTIKGHSVNTIRARARSYVITMNGENEKSQRTASSAASMISASALALNFGGCRHERLIVAQSREAPEEGTTGVNQNRGPEESEYSTAFWDDGLTLARHFNRAVNLVVDATFYEKARGYFQSRLLQRFHAPAPESWFLAVTLSHNKRALSNPHHI